MLPVRLPAGRGALRGPRPPHLGHGASRRRRRGRGRRRRGRSDEDARVRVPGHAGGQAGRRALPLQRDPTGRRVSGFLGSTEGH